MKAEKIKEHILHYSKKFPTDYKDFCRVWPEGFVSGLYIANRITSEVFDQLLIWVRQQ